MNRDATVFVVDDDPGALRSMCWLLESEGFSVEAYSSARGFLAAYDPDHPCCLVLDLRMPEVDGLELQKQLACRGAHAPIIFVSGHGDVPKCAEAMKAGAVDFLEKPADDQKILGLIHQALEKDRRRRRLEAGRPEIAARIRRLTPREHETMLRMLDGGEIKEIAAGFGTSFQTVAKHRARVLAKMEVHNEAELVRLLGDFPLGEEIKGR